MLGFFYLLFILQPLLGTLMPPAGFVCQGIMGPEILQICIPAKAFESCCFWMPCIWRAPLLSSLSVSLSLSSSLCPLFPPFPPLSLPLSPSYCSFSPLSHFPLALLTTSLFFLPPPYLFLPFSLSLSLSFPSFSPSDPLSNDGETLCTAWRTAWLGGVEGCFSLRKRWSRSLSA